MMVRASEKFGFHPQRSFWLRCFLGWAGFALGAAGMGAQVAGPEVYHLAHLRGVYVDAKGNPIAGAAVTLDQDDKVMFSTGTDGAGRFEIKRVTGRFWLHVDLQGHSPVARQVIVGLEGETYLHGSTLYVVAGPAACTDDCSHVFTSKGKFEKALRDNRK